MSFTSKIITLALYSSLAVAQITPTGSVALLLEPLLPADGSNPWASFDTWEAAWQNLIGPNMGSGKYTTYWNTALTGTISVTIGSTSVVGVGTSFKSVFCSGGTTWDGTTYFVGWYPRADGNGVGREAHGLAGGAGLGCPDDTHITILENWGDFSSSAGSISGGSYARWINTTNDVGGSDNINYYDNIAAMYIHYYRTGNTTYRTYARTYCGIWGTMPYIDWGYAKGNGTVPARSFGFLGLWLCALDNNPEYMPGLAARAATYGSKTVTNNNDVREDAALLGMTAACGIADTDGTRKAACQLIVKNAINNRWAPSQRADLGWDNDLTSNCSFGSATWNGCGLTGFATAATGSATVVGSGTNWTTGNMALPDYPNSSFILVCGTVPPTSNSDYDTKSYQVSSVADTTHLTLSRVYDGSHSGESCRFAVEQASGFLTQPFMMGFLGASMSLAEKALDGYDSGSHALSSQFTIDIGTYLYTKGYYTTAAAATYNASYYYRRAISCEQNGTPIVEYYCTQTLSNGSLPPDGTSDSIQSGRYYSMESMHAYCAAYRLGGYANTAMKTAGDLLFGANFGPTGPNGDSNYQSTLSATGFDYLNEKNKSNGFAFGWGMGACWPQARLGVPVHPGRRHSVKARSPRRGR